MRSEGEGRRDTRCSTGPPARFLERFGLKSLDDLPPLEDFAPDEETIEKIKRSLSWELMEEDIR